MNAKRYSTPNFVVTNFDTVAKTLAGFEAFVITDTGSLITNAGFAVTFTNAGAGVAQLTVPAIRIWTWTLWARF